MIISRTVPRIPLGPYPQALLCGQVGKAPRSNKIKRIIKMVLNIKNLFCLYNLHIEFSTDFVNK